MKIHVWRFFHLKKNGWKGETLSIFAPLSLPLAAQTLLPLTLDKPSI